MDHSEAQEPIEEIIGKEGMRKLTQCTDYLVAGKTLSLEVSDPALIDPALNKIREMAPQSRYRQEGIEPLLVIFDFRGNKASQIVERINKEFPRRGPNFRNEHKDDIFIMVAPEDHGVADFNPISAIAKWAPTLILQTKSMGKYPQSIQRIVGEHTTRHFKIG